MVYSFEKDLKFYLSLRVCRNYFEMFWSIVLRRVQNFIRLLEVYMDYFEKSSFKGFLKVRWFES